MSNNIKKIAILGSTSHIAKNLIVGLADKENYGLYLFARDLKSLANFIKLNINNKQTILLTSDFNDFQNYEYDVIINCVGIGDPAKLRTIGAGIFTLTEDFDNLILNYLQNRNSLYINFSSGAAYGSDFTIPAEQNTKASININNMSILDYYSISKINTEAKHRAFSNYNIVDLRVFGFFSKYIDFRTPFFLNDLINSIFKNEVLITGNSDMIRDYVHPSDLLQLVEKCMEVGEINDVFDVYSLESVTKFEIIEYFVRNENLKVEFQNTNLLNSPTGVKSNYFSHNKKAGIIGYKPNYKSMESIISEFNSLIT